MHGEKNDRGGHKGPPPNGIRVNRAIELIRNGVLQEEGDVIQFGLSN